MSDPGAGAKLTGSCICGAVSFTLAKPLRDVTFCHCAICRRVSSHFVAYTACPIGALEIADRRRLRWYKSSPRAERGFCANCGSQLFWRRVGEDNISVSAGALDQPTGLRSGEHIFAETDPDYAREPQEPAARVERNRSA